MTDRAAAPAPRPGTSLVVVLSFEGRDDTLRCVGSLVDGSAAHTVLVVDNGSHDETLEAVAARFPHVRTYPTGGNLGFAGGMDAGIAWGLAHGFEVVTVLNNDTVVDPGCLDRLVATVLAGPGTGNPSDGAAYAVSPRVTYLDDPSRAWFDGGLLDPADGLPRHTSPAESAVLVARAAAPGGAYPVDLLAGCCITATAGTWRLVGDFDERYFLNFEDSDWSLRARRAGVTLLVEPRATVRHRVSGSFVGQHSYLGTYYYTRNLLLFARSWRGHAPRAGVMLWRRVLRPLPSQLRRDGLRETSRRVTVVAAGVLAHLTRRYGRAPSGLERRAARWSSAAG